MLINRDFEMQNDVRKVGAMNRDFILMNQYLVSF